MTRLRLGVREHIRPEPRINGHRHARGHCQLEGFVASPVENSASRSVIFITSVFALSVRRRNHTPIADVRGLVRSIDGDGFTPARSSPRTLDAIRRGWSWRELARASGVPRSTLTFSAAIHRSSLRWWVEARVARSTQVRGHLGDVVSARRWRRLSSGG